MSVKTWYHIKEIDNKFFIYKRDKPLLLPCKLMKRKKVSFDTREEAENYIKYVDKLVSSGEEYMEYIK